MEEHCLHRQAQRMTQAGNQQKQAAAMNIEAIFSSETSDPLRTIRCYNPENCTFESYNVCSAMCHELALDAFTTAC